MSNDASVVIGPAMLPRDEADLQQRLIEQAAEEAERNVEIIETKLAGIKKSLAAAKAEAKRLRSEADRGKSAHGVE
jgi:multidrug resistance efflux pump